MADIAVIFHWRPADMYVMDIDELMSWHAQAVARSGSDE
ncbi:GpE family phage tail protein [Salmonella enterica]|nr:GpE family phage tail protein [Salmonella enterica]EEA2271398.1 GpE family phage tail protein [Salmonella enterica]EFV5114803.1 GpE family phage tail protein [Salmonella enterica]EGB7057503.1 GpE family phage tail protein [Salmonella enterica]EGO6390940.1 GpE family phage tail protein [Salmonella enterica]